MPAAVSSTDSKDTPEDIARAYEHYITTRKSAMEIVSKLDMPIPNPAMEASSNAFDEDTTSTEEKRFTAHDLLPHVSHNLLPSHRSQRFVLQQKSHMTSTLSKHSRLTLQSLERLSDESQILHTYSLSAEQKRSQLVSQPFVQPSDGLQGSSAELDPTINEQALAKLLVWSLAADSSRTTTEETVDKNIIQGEKNVTEALDVLARTEQVLNTTPSDAKNSERQISSNGLWSSLKGDVGL